MWNLADLRLLRELPHVTRISELTINLAHFSTHREALYDFAFPVALKSAELAFIFPSPPALTEDAEIADANLIVLPGLVGCPALTELQLTTVMKGPPEYPFLSGTNCYWDLSPLADLRHLKTLTLNAGGRVQSQAREMQPLRQLESLEHLSLPQHGEGSQWVLALCERPHSLLRLSDLDLSGLYLTYVHLQALRSLPALTTLEPRSLSLPAMTLLSHFPQLLRLMIAPPEMPPELDQEPLGLPPEMAEALIPVDDASDLLQASFLLPFLTCTRLHTLFLERMSFSEADAEEMWRLLPALTTLTFSLCDIPSLHSLRKLLQLRSLTFEPLGSCPCDVQLEHIVACKSLKSARLFGLGPAGGTIAADVRATSSAC